MLKQKRILIILLMLPMFLCFASNEEAHHESNPMEFVGKVVNFLVLFGGLGFLLYKPARAFLDERRRTIETNIQEAEGTRRTSVEKLGAARSRLEKLAREMADVRAEAERAGLADKQRILDEAEKEAKRLKQSAGQDIELLSRFGARELRSFAAGRAAERARQRIRERLTPEGHARLIDRSIERLENLYEESNSG